MKTLKDFDKELDKWHDRTTADFVLNMMQQEAIKWIKALEQCEYDLVSKDLDKYTESTEWIKHFFNISEKDLGE